MSVVGWTVPTVAGVVATVGFGTAAACIGRGSARPEGRIAELIGSAGGPASQDASHRFGSAAVRTFDHAVATMATLGPSRWAAALVAAGVIGLSVGSLAPVVVVALGIGLSVMVEQQRRSRRLAAFDAALPDLVDAMAAAVRSGAVPATALVDAASGAPRVVIEDLDRVTQRVARGERFTDSMAWWSAHRRSPALDMLAAVLATSDEFGGPLAAVLDDVAMHLRHDLRTRDDVRTHSAQAIASAVMLILLPVLCMAITALADPGVLRVLFATPLGALCLGVGLVLEAVAAWWMFVIVRGVR